MTGAAGKAQKQLRQRRVGYGERRFVIGGIGHTNTIHKADGLHGKPRCFAIDDVAVLIVLAVKCFDFHQILLLGDAGRKTCHLAAHAGYFGVHARLSHRRGIGPPAFS